MLLSLIIGIFVQTINKIMEESRKFKNSGIYRVFNNSSNKSYIGSSNNVYRRKKEHVNQLLKNKHDNKYLQYAWNKYGRLNFKFQILERNIPTDKLTERELYWIKKYDTLNRDYGYNLAIPDPKCQHKHSEETKELNKRLAYEQHHGKLTDGEYEELKELKRVKETNIKKRREIDFIVFQIDKLTGKLIQEFKNSIEAANNMNYKNAKKIQWILTGAKPSYKGHVYIYKADYDPNKDYRVIRGMSKRRNVYQYDKDMNLIKEWKDVYEIEKVLGFNKSTIGAGISRKSLTLGYYWKR